MRVVGLAVVGPAQHRTGDALAQHLAVAQPEHGHHPAGVDRLRGAHRNPLAAKRFHEPDQMAGQPVRGQRLGGADAAGGHLVQPAAPRWRVAGRTGA